LFLDWRIIDMPKTIEEYMQHFRDSRNVAALKQFPLPKGGGLACGKGDEPNTTIAIVAGNAGGGTIAVENDGGFEARELPVPTHAQTEINGIGVKAIKLCQKLVP
jgi:hypothetical protein